MLGRSTGFWDIWGLKMPKTCTRPRAPGNAGEYRTCGGDGSVHGAVPSGSLQRFGSVHGGSVPGVSVSAVRFGSRTFLLLPFGGRPIYDGQN